MHVTEPSSRGATTARGTKTSADAILAAAIAIADGVAATFGPMCEVVVHDYRDTRHSVIAVSGDVTHRKVGQGLSSIGLRLLAQGGNAEDEYNYITRTDAGRILKSTTVLLRDNRRRVIGALCINFDITELRMLSHGLSQVVGEGLLSNPEDVDFSQDVREILDDVINREELRLGIPIERWSREERRALFSQLDRRGLLALRGSVAEVAKRLGVSRATAYNYINDLRRNGELGTKTSSA